MANRLDELELPRNPGFFPADTPQNGFQPDGIPQDGGESDTQEGDEPESPGSLGRRFFRPQTLISFVIAGFIVLFFFQRLDIDYGEIWSNIREANLAIYALAFIPFYGSFFLRALRWRLMLARVGISPENGHPVPGTRGLVEIFLLSWFANCILPAKLGDAYRCYLLKRQAKASFSLSLGTLLAERLLDLTVLFVFMAMSALIVFGGHLPGQASQTVYIGSGLLALGAVGLLGMWLARDFIQRRLPKRLHEQYGRLHDGVFACLRRPWVFIGIGLIIWAGEGLRLWLVAQALGADLDPATALFVALMGSLLTTLPITPAGLGVVEVATIKVLDLVGVSTGMGGSIAVMDRVVGYWSVIAVGLVLYLLRMRRELVASDNSEK